MGGVKTSELLLLELVQSHSLLLLHSTEVPFGLLRCPLWTGLKQNVPFASPLPAVWSQWTGLLDWNTGMA